MQRFCPVGRGDVTDDLQQLKNNILVLSSIFELDEDESKWSIITSRRVRLAEINSSGRRCSTADLGVT